MSQKLRDENQYLQKEIDDQHNLDDMVGNSPSFLNVLEQISLVAATDSTVLIRGENGTGKELVARAIHHASQRKNASLVKVNCAAFTPSLLESELFGHEKGAFTGAMDRRQGRFELADGGTLFLDEIGELSLEAQSKLLRVLQEREFERVGGTQTIQVDLRVIAATNRDLKAMVEEGSFRMDLFYRLNVFPIQLPPLRERIADIPLLVDAILAKLSKKLGKPLAGVTSRGMSVLMSYDWPGNIRELQNLLERQAILAKEQWVEVDETIPANRGTPEVLTKTMAAIEKEYIVAVLEQQGWRIGGAKGAAKVLGLPESTLRSRMQKLEISRNNQ